MTIKNRKLSLPESGKELYELDEKELDSESEKIARTNQFRYPLSFLSLQTLSLLFLLNIIGIFFIINNVVISDPQVYTLIISLTIFIINYFILSLLYIYFT